MKRLVLKEWKDAKAVQVSANLLKAQNNIETADKQLTSDIENVKKDLAISIPFSFSPDNYK